MAAKDIHTRIDRTLFRDLRLERICAKIHDHNPKLVVMYGKSDREYWRGIAGAELEFDRPQKIGSTIFVMTTHPNTRGRTDVDWLALAQRLREL